MRYAEALKAAMEHLAEDERVIFLGQAVSVPGTGMFNTLVDIDPARRIELPVEKKCRWNLQWARAGGLHPGQHFSEVEFSALGHQPDRQPPG